MEPTRHSGTVRANKTEARAIASLFLGVASFAFGPLTGIPAIALGSAARKNAAHAGVMTFRRGAPMPSQTSLKLATAGTLTGFFGMGFFVVFALYLGNALLGAQTEPTSAATSTVEESQAKLTAPASKPRPAAHRDVEMMRSVR